MPADMDEKINLSNGEIVSHFVLSRRVRADAYAVSSDSAELTVFVNSLRNQESGQDLRALCAPLGCAFCILLGSDWLGGNILQSSSRHHHEGNRSNGVDFHAVKIRKVDSCLIYPWRKNHLGLLRRRGWRQPSCVHCVFRGNKPV